VVCLWVTSEQFGESAGTASTSSISALALVVRFGVTSRQSAAATSSSGTGSVASLALVVGRTSVKISPMSVVLFLGQLLSITAEELG
jgi:diaminopimelate epimerase